MSVRRTPAYKRGAYKPPPRKNNPFLSPDTDPGSWEESANCVNKAYELFEYQDQESPLAQDLDFKTRMELNRVNYQLASEICIECPVMLQCGEAATGEEKHWTVRGGEPPGRMAYEIKTFDETGKPYKLGEDRVCNEGHVVKGGGRCRECKRIANARRRRNLRAAARADAVK